MSLLRRLKAFTNQRWLQSTFAVISGGKDAKRPDFDYRAAVMAYRSWVYAAANLNAVAVASVPLRLYVRADNGGAKLWNTRRPSRRQKAYLAGASEQRPGQYARRKAAEFGDEYEVVEDSHPILELLAKVNPYQNGYDATVLRVLFTELTGNAYLHPVIDQTLGIPVELWPMQSQFVEIVPGQKESANFIEGYLYGVKQEQKQLFKPEEVIHFKRPNPANLYYGIGKVEAAWGAVMANAALHEMDLSFFENKGRPDWLLSIKGEASPDEIERFEAQIDEKLRGTKRTGRFLTATADIDVKPLSFPPKDLTGRDEIVEEIAAVFGVPVSMLKANDPNLASSTTGFAQWKETTILPMLRMDEETLNQTLLPLFGIEGDAFLAYDNPVMEDERFALESRRAAVAGGWRTANEARMEEGREPIDDPMADRLLINGQPLGGPPPAALPGFGAASLDNPTESAGGTQSAALTFEPTPEPETKDALSDCVSEKIPKLIDEGYPQDQAVAIAYSMCSEGKSFEDAIASIERDEAIREKAISDIDTKPPQSVADNARRALEVRARKPESQRGMTAVGLARARDLQNRKPLSEDTIRRMLAYFERHESDKQGETWDDQGKGWQAWNGWGGDDGWAWARRKVEQFDREREKRISRVEKSCGCGCAEKPVVSQKRLWSDLHTKAAGDAEAELAAITDDEKLIARAVDKVLQGQIRSVLKELRAATAPTAELLQKVEQILAATKWDRELVAAMKPFMRASLQEGIRIGTDAIRSMASDLSSYELKSPELESYIENESVRLSRGAARGVNRYTVTRVSEILGEGVQNGETVDQLTEKVQDWAGKQGDAERSTLSRARTIARTEAMRASRAAEVEAWKSSGIVEGKTWLLAPDPCEFCEAAAKAFGEKSIGVGESFFAKGETLEGADGGTLSLDYEAVDGPPLHPNCRCSLLPKLAGDYADIQAEIDRDLEAELARIAKENP